MATIMTTSEKAIIIEPDWGKIKEVKMKLGGLKKKKIMVASICCLNDKFLKIKELTDKLKYLKIFHDGKEEDFNNMLLAFELRDRSDIAYTSIFDNRSIADCYNKYVFKDFPSNVLISRREESYRQEL